MAINIIWKDFFAVLQNCLGHQLDSCSFLQFRFFRSSFFDARLELDKWQTGLTLDTLLAFPRTLWGFAFLTMYFWSFLRLLFVWNKKQLTNDTERTVSDAVWNQELYFISIGNSQPLTISGHSLSRISELFLQRIQRQYLPRRQLRPLSIYFKFVV